MTPLQRAIMDLESAYAARDAAIDRAVDEVLRQFEAIIRRRHLVCARARADAPQEAA